MREQLRVLIVEDNELDVEKVERGFKRLNISSPIINAKNGFEALDILRGAKGKEKILRPFVILLDLNMPRMNGIEFLRELRKDDCLRNVLVFVLTTSDRQEDIEEAYQYNIAGYIVKPIKRTEMVAALERLHMYWNLCEHPLSD